MRRRGGMADVALEGKVNPSPINFFSYRSITFRAVACPIRFEFDGALYFVVAGSNVRKAIDRD
jgi:hypothetical protein